MKEFVILENDANQRLDKYIQKSFKKIPSSLMYKMIRNKKIKVNHKRCEISQKLQNGDLIQFYMSDEFFDDAVFELPEGIHDLKNIVYEDDNIIIVDKPKNLLVQEDANETVQTLNNQILKYLIDTGKYDPNVEKSFRPACINRIDRNTQGLVIACKKASAARYLSEKIRLHEIEKHYLCIVEGKTKDHEYLIHGYEKNEKMNKAFISNDITNGRVQVELEYQTLNQNARYSLCDVNLITGKSHQIRAQMAHIGHPLVGDIKYGSKDKNLRDQCLYAYKMIFAFNDDSEFSYLSNKIIEVKQPSILDIYNKLNK